MINKILPFITICMPVRNEERSVGNTLGELLKQDYPIDRYEIIVADGESVDRTREIVQKIAKKNPQIILMSNPRRLPSSGRNVGFRNGKGDIFLVIDGHCEIDNNFLLQNIVTCFEKSGAQCLGRPQPLDPSCISKFQKAVALARGSRIGHSGDSFIYSNYEGYVSPVSHGAVYKREILDKVGYVDEAFDACEDVDFNYRVKKAGFATYMSPQLAIKYYPRKNLRDLFKQMVRYGEGRFSFIKKHPEAFTLEILIPPLFVIGIFLIQIVLLLTLISELSIFNLILFFLIVVYSFYFLFILAESLRIGINSSFFSFFYLPTIFFTIHSGLGWGFLKKILFKMRFIHKLEKALYSRFPTKNFH